MPAEIGSSTRVEIAKRLVKLLRETEITQRWLEFAEGSLSGDLLGKSDFREHILLWLGDEEVQSHFDGEQLRWIGSAMEFPVVVLFQGLATAIARRLRAQQEVSTSKVSLRTISLF